jgi:hypothetical protein
MNIAHACVDNMPISEFVLYRKTLKITCKYVSTTDSLVNIRAKLNSPWKVKKKGKKPACYPFLELLEF